jgi:hypothetical protein
MFAYHRGLSRHRPDNSDFGLFACRNVRRQLRVYWPSGSHFGQVHHKLLMGPFTCSCRYTRYCPGFSVRGSQSEHVIYAGFAPILPVLCCKYPSNPAVVGRWILTYGLRSTQFWNYPYKLIQLGLLNPLKYIRRLMLKFPPIYAEELWVLIIFRRNLKNNFAAGMELAWPKQLRDVAANHHLIAAQRNPLREARKLNQQWEFEERNSWLPFVALFVCFIRIAVYPCRKSFHTRGFLYRICLTDQRYNSGRNKCFFPSW